VVLSFVGLLVIVVLGLALLAGIVLIVRAKRGGLPFPSCGACRYDLSGTIGSETRCPECGAAFAEAGIVPPHGGPANRRLMWAGIALVIAALGCLGSGVTTSMMSYRAAVARQQALIQARQAAQAQQAAVAAAEARAAEAKQRAEEAAERAAAGAEASAPSDPPSPGDR
jgi:hypothetical protein